MTAPVRFRFAEFVVSPRQRLLLRNGQPVPLIPKYFDLLVLLIGRRRDAVSKHAIFAEVWSDVIVSDGALSQAIRTLRRTLGDDSRDPRFIRTVSRHGYQFVFPDVAEESDDDRIAQAVKPPRPDVAAVASIDPLVDRLVITAAEGGAARAEARDLAEQLHVLGTADALAHLAARPHHAPALAIMRDARWNVPGAGDVPLLTDPHAFGIVLALVRLRLADVGQTVARRWAGGAAAGAVGGAVAGACGGIALYLSPTSSARPEVALALAAIGALAGGFGAAGVAAGLAAAEVLARSRRGLALVACGGISGGVVAAIAELVLAALLEGLFGLHLPSGGIVAFAIDGLVIGAAVGGGYGLATSQPPGGGLAAPVGGRRLAAALIVGACCAVAAALLALAGRPLIGGLVHDIARSSRESQLVLAPLGRLIGEPGFGPITRAILGAFEGWAFGSSVAWGLTRRPRTLSELSAENH